MGSKNKLKRFKDNEKFDNVFQPTRQELLSGDFEFKGSWAKKVFNNSNPITLELGCGKGEYSVELARQNPDINFIGIDIKGARFWRGAKTANEKNIPNVKFIRAQIELVEYLFEKNEISEIWVTFPDPQITYKRTKHRLTNLEFLNKYKQILNNEGSINLKTDSEFLHGYTLGLLQAMKSAEILYSNHDIYKRSGSPKEATEIKTHYENLFLNNGKPITFIKFKI
ncbi:tRNA (guanosine(46)-N7)-methyltransferase TrmB [Flavobacteriaceae bacterium]|nr:tRNA (guanosine(46)-N7)-methyltransferase TrmB [Flavobacteriaceae bacterium]